MMDDLEALFETAVEQHQPGSLVVAKALYKQILRRNPRHIGVLNNLGAAPDGLGLFDEAIDTYRAALKIAPHDANLHNNLGNLLKELDSLNVAVEHYEASIELDASNSEVYNNLGAMLQGLGRFDEAFACFRKALALREDYVEALSNLGDTLQVVDRLEEAGECYRRAFELAPNDGLRIKLALLLSPVHASLEALESACNDLVAEIDALCAKPALLIDPLHEVNAAPFYLVFQVFNDRELKTRIGELFREALPESAAHSLPLPLGDRLRLEFISSFWSSQSAGSRYEDGIMRIVDTDEYEITVFAAGPAASREALFDGAELNIVRLPLNLGAARQMVANRGLDVLTYADIGTYLERHLAEVAPGVRLIHDSLLDTLESYRHADSEIAGLRPSCLDLAAPAPAGEPLGDIEAAGLLHLAEVVPGQCAVEKIWALAEIARRTPLGNLVEIGSLWGKSALTLVGLSRRYRLGPLLCVDPWSAQARHQFDKGGQVNEWSDRMDFDFAVRIFRTNLAMIGRDCTAIFAPP